MYRRQRTTPAFQWLTGLLLIVGIGLLFVAAQRLNINQPSGPRPTDTRAPRTATPLPPTSPPVTALDMRLHIASPKAGLSTGITGLYFTPQGDAWDLTYLDNQAGHLEGTANLGDGGNYVLAGHVELQDGRAGPFVNIGRLRSGDEIMIYSEAPENPLLVRYRVTEVKQVPPEDLSVLRNRGYEELTLITCADWDQTKQEYLTRIIVHARPY
jgi:LPXTG-site transpeptidase (sortase) family protein